MAARPEVATYAQVVDLRELSPGSLDALLEEEVTTWRNELRWDFSSSAGLVRRFADMQSLGGHAAVVDGAVVGYAYTVAEEYKGLIGDLYVAAAHRTPDLENRLLTAAVETLAKLPGVRRIESQVLLLDHPRDLPEARPEHLRLHERQFMVFDLAPRRELAEGRGAGSLDLSSWQSWYQDDVARLIADAYGGHIDSQINDQYLSIAGARRFLHNIVEYPGCGNFDGNASFLAWSTATGRMAGVCLASQVAHDVGHITQLCVSPGLRGQGAGYELLSSCLRAMAEAGYQQCSLTVTSANRSAIRFYEQVGFRTTRQFSAMVWDNLRPARRRFFS